MQKEAENNLIFLSYDDGLHAYETLFSMLTLGRFPSHELQDVKVKVVTDRPDFFGSYGFEVVSIDRDIIREWKGPAHFHHRCKIMAMKHVLSLHGGKCILVDGDTYFLRPPLKLFRHIGPGRSVLHMMEGRLGDSRHEFNRRVGAILQQRQPGYHPLVDLADGLRTVQWNSGVVGIDARDGHCLDEALSLLDYLLTKLNVPILEQISLSIVLCQRTQVRPARDVVFHYFVNPARRAIRAELPLLLAQTGGMTPRRRAEWLYSHRFRLPMRTRMRVLAKDVLNTAGVLPRRDRCICL